MWYNKNISKIIKIFLGGESCMIFFFEFPIIFILIFILSVLGINIIPVITCIAAICSILFLILGFYLICDDCDDGVNFALLSFLMAAVNMVIIHFLDGKYLCLWDIFARIF